MRILDKVCAFHEPLLLLHSTMMLVFIGVAPYYSSNVTFVLSLVDIYVTNDFTRHIYRSLTLQKFGARPRGPDTVDRVVDPSPKDRNLL